MPKFAYTAVEASSGRALSGTIDGVSAERAAAALKAQGLAPTSLQSFAPTTAGPKSSPDRAVPPPTRLPPAAGKRAGLTSTPGEGARRKHPIVFGRVVGAKALTLFTRQLATLVRAGMPLVRALGVLARQERNAAFRRVIEEIAEIIRSGGTLSEGLTRHRRTFDPLYINMVRAGESGGALEEALERLARFMEKAERIKGKVTTAMTYPLVVVLLAVGIVTGLMVFVVPKFEQIFAELLKGQPLPALTRSVIAVSSFVHHHAGVSLGLIALAATGFVLFRRSSAGSRIWDRTLIRMPVLGPLFLKAAIARFTRTLGTLLASGVPILDALLITRDTAGNAHVADAIRVVHDRVRIGEGIAGPLERTGVFPGMVTSMIQVGEETGALSEMLARIADAYDEEVDNAVASLTSLLEPVMIVFLAVMVGTVVLALFLPIVSIIQHLL